MTRRGVVVLALIVLLAVAARWGVMRSRIGRPADDPDRYLPLATSVANGQGLRIEGRLSAYRPPLYPIVLAAVAGDTSGVFTLSIAGLHLVLGAITVLLTAEAARRWGLPARAILAAAAIVAFDPVLVVQGRSVMTETLAATLLAGALAGVAGNSRRSAAVGGLAFGFAALCRPSTLPAAILAAGGAALSGRKGLVQAGILLAATLAPLLPWGVRNQMVFGEPIVTTTHGGYTLALANNPVYYSEIVDGPSDAVWSGNGQRRWLVEISRATDRMSEPESDRHLRDRAVRTIRQQPGSFLRATAQRLGRFWGLAPSAKIYPTLLRSVIAAWTLPLLLLAFAGLTVQDSWRWPRSVAAAILIALTSVHAIYWTDLRMRAPGVPALALLAAIGAGGRKSERNLRKN